VAVVATSPDKLMIELPSNWQGEDDRSVSHPDISDAHFGRTTLVCRCRTRVRAAPSTNETGTVLAMAHAEEPMKNWKRPNQNVRTPVATLAPIALLLMTSTALAGTPTDLTCWMTNSSPAPGQPPIRRWSDSTQTINVLVDSSTTTSGVQTSFYNPYLVAKATEIAVERWNEQAGIPQRLVFAGFKTDGADQALGTVVIQAGGCAAESFGAASGGCDVAAGFCTKGQVSLFLSTTEFCGDPSARYADSYADPNDQAGFVDLLVHEIGHTLGRFDAYKTACGQTNQTSVMETADVQHRDLTDFDRLEMQAVYGTRAATSSVKRRILLSTEGAWSAPVNTGMTLVDIAPGPGSSSGVASIPVTTVRFFNTTTQNTVRLLTAAGGLLAETVLTGQFPARKPVSTSFGPNGGGVMAYMTETGGNNSERRLCIRRRTSGVFGPEGCSNPCSGTLPNNAVSTAHDPVTGRFLVAYSCEGQIRIRALATSVDCTALHCAEVNAVLSLTSAAETPVVACEPNGQAGSNCRLVYARRNVVGQKIAWRSFGVVLGFSSNQITIGNEVPTEIESEHAPAVTYYGDAFQMALTRNGTLLQTYYMFPSYSGSGPGWTYDGTLNTTGWISPPFYSPTQQCISVAGQRSCAQLHLLWVQYR
jgi:hypothetical protein